MTPEIVGVLLLCMFLATGASVYLSIWHAVALRRVVRALMRRLKGQKLTVTVPPPRSGIVGGVFATIAGIDVGNIVSMAIIPGSPSKDDVTFRLALDEHLPELYDLFFKGKSGAVNIRYLADGGQVVWTFDYPDARVKPRGLMDFGEFNDWVTYSVEIETITNPEAGLPSEQFQFAPTNCWGVVPPRSAPVATVEQVNAEAVPIVHAYP